MSASSRLPELVVRLPLERSPRRCVDAKSVGDHKRLLDWLRGHPQLREIVERSVPLEQVARRT